MMGWRMVLSGSNAVILGSAVWDLGEMLLLCGILGMCDNASRHTIPESKLSRLLWKCYIVFESRLHEFLWCFVMHHEFCTCC